MFCVPPITDLRLVLMIGGSVRPIRKSGERYNYTWRGEAVSDMDQSPYTHIKPYPWGQPSVWIRFPIYYICILHVLEWVWMVCRTLLAIGPFLKYWCWMAGEQVCCDTVRMSQRQCRWLVTWSVLFARGYVTKHYAFGLKKPIKKFENNLFVTKIWRYFAPALMK